MGSEVGEGDVVANVPVLTIRGMGQNVGHSLFVFGFTPLSAHNG